MPSGVEAETNLLVAMDWANGNKGRNPYKYNQTPGHKALEPHRKAPRASAQVSWFLREARDMAHDNWG